MNIIDYMARNPFEGQAETHLLQNRGKISIAEHPHDSLFALDMKIPTATEKFFKTRSCCLVLFKKDPDACSRYVGFTWSHTGDANHVTRLGTFTSLGQVSFPLQGHTGITGTPLCFPAALLILNSFSLFLDLL